MSGRDAVLVDDFVAGGVILGGGQLQGRAVAQRQDALHRPFAESLFADDDGVGEGFLIILEAAGHDLGGAGAARN